MELPLKYPAKGHNDDQCFQRLLFEEEEEIIISDITDIIGDGGWWQIKILIITTLICIPTAWNHLGMSFLAYPTDHWCSRPPNTNISVDTWWTEFLPNTTLKGIEQHSQCEMKDFNATIEDPVINPTIACHSYEYDHDFQTVITEWHLVCDREWMLSSSQTVYMMGFLFAVFLSGHFADAYGRHPALLLNIVIHNIFGTIAEFSTSFSMFTVCRFFIGFGYGGNTLITYVILVETIGPKWRVKFSQIQGLGWTLGLMILPVIAWFVPDWYNLQLIFTLPSFIFFLCYWLIPESPRWLLAKGRLNEAVLVLKDAARSNGKDVTNLEAKARILQGEEKHHDRKITILDLLRTPTLRMRTLILYFVWFTVSFTYYGLTLNTNELHGNHYINFSLSGLMEIVSAIFCLATLDRFGRKRCMVFALLIGGLTFFVCLLIPQDLSMLETALVMIGKIFNSASFSIVYVFSAEIFPTVARNVGIGTSSTIARVGAALSPFMKDLGNITSPSVPIFLYGLLSIIAALLVMKIPETKDQVMPQSIDEAENFGKKQCTEMQYLNG